MAEIRVTDLTFSYENSFDTIFQNVNFHIDTAWKLGLIGRNGKGKTTLLNLFMGRYGYTGSIITSMAFDYFPYPVTDDDMDKSAMELAERWKPHTESWQILAQMAQIRTDPECLYRPFGTLSHGERTRVMLAVLFAAENEFLLIDEPTNHLDINAREIVKDYLSHKKGFILVSHDRDLLDAVIDHVLILNRSTIEVQTGNFSSWWENKERSDVFAIAENEKHLKEINKLKIAADRSSRWAEKNENTKIGFDPVKEHDRSKNTRAFIGAKTKKMQARVKSYEKRIDKEIEEKENLLQDIEQVAELKLQPLTYHKERLVSANRLSLCYEEGIPLFKDMSFEIKRGDRVTLTGENGSGKSSIIRAVLETAENMLNPDRKENHPYFGVAMEGYDKPLLTGSGGRDGSDINKDMELHISGELKVAPNLVISYINQDTSFLHGTLRNLCRVRSLEESLLLAVLRQLDFGREQFAKNMSDFSEGQKKKVLIAASLITPAHLYIWDEPLNYIDVFSRMQIEKLILKFKPTMLLVEHDVRFQETIATKCYRL